MATVDSTGITIRTAEEILSAIYSAWAASSELGTTFRTSDDSPQAQIARPVAESLAQIEEALAALVSVFSRSTAYGQWLDDAGERVGVPRRVATKSTVTATVNLDASTTLPAGSQAADSSDSSEVYATLTAVTNSGGTPANVSVEMEAVAAGSATFVAAGQLTEIVTAVSGWNSVTNAADSTLGTDLETDDVYRVRIAGALSGAGSGTIDAIKSAIAVVDGVTSVGVLENATDTTDALGLPPHSFEAVVLGGDDDDIAQAIWDNKPIGIESYSDTSDSGLAIDTAGVSQTVEFSRVVDVDIYLSIALTVDPVTYVGNTEFQAQLVQAASAAFGLGDDVIQSKLIALAHDITGVDDVTLLQLDTSPSPASGANISITGRQVAAFATTRITVISS